MSFPAGRLRGDPFHQKDKLVPPHGTETGALAQEYLRVEPPHRQALVIQRITAALPMEEFQHGAAAVGKHIHIPVHRVQFAAAHGTAQAVRPLAQIHRVAAHHKPVVFIQVEHAFFLSSPFIPNKKTRHISDGYPHSATTQQKTSCFFVFLSKILPINTGRGRVASQRFAPSSSQIIV